MMGSTESRPAEGGLGKRKFMHLTNIRKIAAAMCLICIAATPSAQAAGAGDFSGMHSTNSYYMGNRAPLLPSELIPLPIADVQPGGWLRETLKRQADGLCGHLGEISAWLQKSDNAWLSRDGKGKYGWEEVPYWLRGYLQMAYISGDPKMIAEGELWVKGALNSQRPDGDFGPDQRFDDDHSRDFWANMLMLFCFETYYEHTHDARVPEVMSRYFKFQLTVPDNQFLTHYWQKMRGGDNLHSVYWLYNLTGDPSLLEVATKIHRCTANWEMKNDLPNWHNVNITESFREPAEHYLQTHNGAELEATYADFREVRKRYGQVPGGLFGGDENCRPGHSDPHQGVETCGMVEQMFSDELLLEITGDVFWADNCEEVAFNDYPAALMPDLRSLRYLTAPNMVLSDSESHAPGLDNGGPFLIMNPFSSRCCQHNHSMGWPAFCKHLWYATPDNGICATLYSACSVSARVGSGGKVHIEEQSHYPFEESIRFTVKLDESDQFPIYFRIPAWCKNASLKVNGKSVSASLRAGHFARVERSWKSGDEVALTLPMNIDVHRWAANHDSVSVERGPLIFSLHINEDYEEKNSVKTAIEDSKWQPGADTSKWPSYEIHPASPWNFGLTLDKEHPENSFEVVTRSWPADNYPFTPDHSPIELTAHGRQIPGWTLDSSKLCGVLQQSPAASDAAVQAVELIPEGAARLRISAFPTVTDDGTGHHWTSSQ